MGIDAIMIGAGGFGRETLDVIEAHNLSRPAEAFTLLGVVDDDPSAQNLGRLRRRGVPHLGTLNEFVSRRLPPPTFRFFIGIGNPGVRSRVAEYCESLGWLAGSVSHPSASIGSQVTIGPGVIVCGGVQLSTNVRLGRHVHLNPGAIVGHDATIGDFTSVNPAAVVSGEVVVEENALIGAGAIVLQELTIGAASVVGAGACVTRDVPPRMIVAGVPARQFGALS